MSIIRVMSIILPPKTYNVRSRILRKLRKMALKLDHYYRPINLNWAVFEDYTIIFMCLLVIYCEKFILVVIKHCLNCY